MARGPEQLPLALGRKVALTLDNFEATAAMQQCLRALRDLAAGGGEFPVLLWGGPGVGLTHLARAVAGTQWLDLGRVQNPQRELGALFEGTVAIDNLEAAAGHSECETALFHLHNRLQQSGGRLLYTTHTPPQQLPLTLPDLRSRVLAGPVFLVPSPDDPTRSRALERRAQELGFRLAPEVTQYLLTRSSRHMGDLMALLTRLDTLTLQRQRRLTVPFVKSVLDGGPME